jgi:hypothetical protein
MLCCGSLYSIHKPVVVLRLQSVTLLLAYALFPLAACGDGDLLADYYNILNRQEHLFSQLSNVRRVSDFR